MISSILQFIANTFLFIIKVIGLFSQIAGVTSLRVIFILCILIYSLSRYFRLKQPNLPQNLAAAIAGIRNQLADSNQQQCSTANNNCGPIANRAGCLDSIENSRSAIKNVRIDRIRY